LHEGDKTLVVISFQIVDIVNFQYIIGFRVSMEVDNCYSLGPLDYLFSISNSTSFGYWSSKYFDFICTDET
jgi:uncharacterized membrane protein